MTIQADQFKFSGPQRLQDNKTFTWTSPSNIALVKYWGKFENQIPANPSISFTLSNCHTKTTAQFTPSKEFSFEIYSEGKAKDSFRPKIEKFISAIKEYCPYLNTVSLRIDTENTFPHSSGIASSASGMSALALCIMSLEKTLNPNLTEDQFTQKASFLARIGSGSAARSVFPTLASWGKCTDIKDSTDLIATPFQEAHTFYQTYQDCILIVDEGEKVVSSTVGHGLMKGHPYAENRFKQAHENLGELINVLKNDTKVDEFIRIVESEALTLHAMMMTSNPYFILMKPNTLRAIELIWKYRHEHNSKICFTLDAGANVHVLYPAQEKTAIDQFILSELAPLCHNDRVIFDHVGTGPQQFD
ncbi:MAG: diphosphomevalonate decarboxylase [Flavobacteriales bacterium]|nr:diphosphomevalonate decarboxylase [Flavobacteriales bacterium]